MPRIKPHFLQIRNFLLGILDPWNKLIENRYDRFQTLAGLINGIFLIFIAFYIFIESLERIYDPPQIFTDKLLLVAFIGLAVNLVGILFFHEHAHFQGLDDEHSCSHHHPKKSDIERQVPVEEHSDLHTEDSYITINKGNPQDPEKLVLSKHHHCNHNHDHHHTHHHHDHHHHHDKKSSKDKKDHHHHQHSNNENLYGK